MKPSRRRLTIALTILTASLLCASVMFVTLAQKGARRPILILTQNGQVVVKIIGPKGATDVHVVWGGPGVPEGGGFGYWTKNNQEMPKSRFQFGANINDIHFSPTGRVPRLPPIPAPPEANDVEIGWEEDGRITEAWWTRDGQQLAAIPVTGDAQELSVQFNRQRGQSTQGTATNQLVGLVYDKDSRPGDRVSASLTTDPKKYENIPALGVVEMKVPANSAASTNSLQGLVVDLGDGRQQPANQPLTVQIGQNSTSIPVKVIQEGNTQPVAQSSVPITQGQSNITVTNTGKPSDFTTPPVCLNTSVIHGPLSGDAGTSTRIMVDNQTVNIVAETPRSAYFELPAKTPVGLHTLTVQDGAHRAQFPIVNMALVMKADQLQLQRGQSTNYSATVQIGQVPDSVWQNGGVTPEVVNTARLAKLAPGFHVPNAGEPGAILLSIENASRDTVSVKPSDQVTRALHKEDFPNGQFTISGTIQSKQTGGFVLNGLAEAFFAPVQGHQTEGGVISGGPGPVAQPTPTPLTPTDTTSGEVCKWVNYKTYRVDEFKRVDSKDKDLEVRHESAHGGGTAVSFHCKAAGTFIFVVTKDSGNPDVVSVTCTQP